MPADFAALKRRMVSGAFVTSGAQVARQLVQLATVALLARALGPRPYGVVALAVAIAGLGQVVADLGLGSAVVREPRLSPAQESTLFRFGVSAAAVVCLALELAAPRLASLFGEPELNFALRAVAPGLLLATALQTRRAVLQRAMRFRLLAAIDLASVAAGSALAIVLASFGLRTGALVAGSLAQQLLSSAAILRFAGPAPRAPLDRAAVRPQLRYGLFLMGFGVVNYFARTLDNMLVGGLMGAVALGLYEKAYALMMLPVTQISAALAQVMQPALASVRADRDRLAFLYLGAAGKVAGLAFPLAALCATCAGPIVRLLLGARFEGAAPLFATLAAVMGFQPLLSSVGWLYTATGATGRMFFWGAVNAAVLCGAILFGALEGDPLSVARAYAVAVAVLFLPTLALALRVAGIGFAALLRRIAAPALSAAAAWGAVAALPGLPLLATLGVLGTVYAAVHLVLDRAALVDLVRFLDPRRALQG
jgi:O-antigen/teichoic acid export membrane protein